MIEVLGIIAFVLLFAAFPLITRENRRRHGCSLCRIRKAFGLCDGCPLGEPLEGDAPGQGASGDRS